MQVQETNISETKIKNITPVQKRSIIERIFHAVCFEVIATAICAPVGALLLDRPILQVGGLTLVLASVAMLWNIIYNMIFDRLWPVHRVTRTARVRALHAVGFEMGFIVFGVSIAAWMLKVSFMQALMLELGLIAFFLPYSMLYNWVYDTLRAKIIQRRQNRGVLAQQVES